MREWAVLPVPCGDATKIGAHLIFRMIVGGIKKTLPHDESCQAARGCSPAAEARDDDVVSRLVIPR